MPDDYEFLKAQVDRIQAAKVERFRKIIAEETGCGLSLGPDGKHDTCPEEECPCLKAAVRIEKSN